MRWHRQALRRDNIDVLKKALDCKVVGRRGRGEGRQLNRSKRLN